MADPDELLERHQDTDLPAYYGSIENMDAEIGRVLCELEMQGEAEKTFIVFMSDRWLLQQFLGEEAICLREFSW